MTNAVRIDAPDSLPQSEPESAEDSWPGYYFSNDWQYVTDADALALAAALERAMPELPDEELCPVEIRTGPLGIRGS